MKVLGVLLGVGAAIVGAFVAGIMGLAFAGSGSSRETGADVLFLVPFVLFAVISLLPLVIAPVRRVADGLLASAGLTCAVLLLAAGGVLVATGIQRL